jgi:hypothetical protein
MEKMNPPGYRPELPLIPVRMLTLPVRRGYPVPWFVSFHKGPFVQHAPGPVQLSRRC